MTASSRRRVDLLAYEHDHGRLSPMALAAGRGIEVALGRLHRSGGSAWAERVDVSHQGDAGVMQNIEAARQVERVMDRVSAIVGTIDARLIRRILGDGVGFEQAAALEGKAGTRGTGYVAARFRDALEELAQASRVVGAVAPKIIDKHSTAAEALNVDCP